MNASFRRRLVIGATVLALCAPAAVTVNVAHALPTIDAADAPGCAGELDTRYPNIGVDLDVTGPDEIDVTKDMTFKLKGTGINPETTPGASNGVYVVLTPTSVWRIGHCSTMTGDGDALIARWIPAGMFKNNGGKLDLDLKVEANSLQPGQTYSLGFMAAHGLALSERYFDRGITFKVPAVGSDKVETPFGVRGEVNDKRDITVKWDYSQSVPGTAWRAQVECVEHCTSAKTLRTLDNNDPNTRSVTFEDGDAGVYQASVNASRWVNGEYVTTGFGVSPRFVVGDVDKPISQRLHATGIEHDYGEYVAPGTEVTLKSPVEGKTEWTVAGVKNYTVDPATQALRFTMPTNPVQVEAAAAKEGPAPAAPAVPAGSAQLPAWGAALIGMAATLLAVVAGLAAHSPVVKELWKRFNP